MFVEIAFVFVEIAFVFVEIAFVSVFAPTPTFPPDSPASSLASP